MIARPRFNRTYRDDDRWFVVHFQQGDADGQVLAHNILNGQCTHYDNIQAFEGWFDETSGVPKAPR